MEKDKAIPQGYMTVGEIAKKMNVTVRTLQYYDKEGLFSPSSQSEGGRRLYTHKDMMKLYQIVSMKSLGFSLDDIKNRLLPLDTPAEVACALTDQAAIIRERLETLSESLKEIEALKEEVLQMQQVDFKKYSDIIINLRMRNESYWLIKHLDDDTLEHFRSRLDKDSGSAITLMETFTHLLDEAVRLQKNGVAPESEKGQNFAKEFWDTIMDFTKGDMSILSALMETRNIQNPITESEEKQAILGSFIEPALGAYFTILGYDPFKEENK